MLTREEMVEILEAIARDEGQSATAKIQAIRTLRIMEEGGEPNGDKLEDLIQTK